jgi:putative flippase GtrA
MNSPVSPRSTSIRWLVFNSVGALGIVVQLGLLFLLTHFLGFRYLAATALAVETAVLHNFVWHEHWTWADRHKECGCSVFRRLLWFHATNGVLSISGNLVLMKLFVEKMALNYLAANILAVGICSIFNFFAGDRVVFRNTETISHKEK